MPEHITDNKEVSYDDSDINFDEEISNGEDSDEKNRNEAN